jgi:hypothetical protein
VEYINTSVSSTDSRPFYGTLWFNLLASAVVVFLLVLAAIWMPDVEGRPAKGLGQFGVVLVAIYWVFLFPKLRKMRKNTPPEPPLGKNPSL